MSSPKQIALFGAGGFAKEVAWLIAEHNKQADLQGGTEEGYSLAGFIEDQATENQQLNSLPVFSWERFGELNRQGDIAIAIAVGDPKGRQQCVERCQQAGYAFASLIHPGVQMSDSVTLGEGSIICCGSILTVDIELGQQVHINLDCTIGHDVRIGEFSTLAPGVHVSGHVHIGKGVYIGTGACLIDGSRDQPLVIADGTVIAAGACVTGNTEANSLYAGVPAKLKKHYS